MTATATVLLVMLVACSDPGPPRPSQLAGTYTLQTVDGQAVPYRHRVETGKEHYVVAGSIAFSGQNTAIFTQLWREHEVAPNPERWLDPYTGLVVNLTYTRNGNSLTIETSSEVVPPPGPILVSGDGAIITLEFVLDPYHYDGRNHVFVFRRD